MRPKNNSFGGLPSGAERRSTRGNSPIGDSRAPQAGSPGPFSGRCSAWFLPPEGIQPGSFLWKVNPRALPKGTRGPTCHLPRKG
jgi:hypothetical protein